jgi:hypothetical protein
MMSAALTLTCLTCRRIRVEGKTDAIPWYVALGQALICILLPITFLFPDQDRQWI